MEGEKDELNSEQRAGGIPIPPPSQPQKFQGPPVPKVPYNIPSLQGGGKSMQQSDQDDAQEQSTRYEEAFVPGLPASQGRTQTKPGAGTVAVPLMEQSRKQRLEEAAGQEQEEGSMEVHTMREDLTEAKKILKEAEKARTTFDKEQEAQQPAQQEELSPQLPLPPEGKVDVDKEKEAKVQRIPTRVRGRWIRVVSIVLGAVILLGGGGVGAWWYFTIYSAGIGGGAGTSGGRAENVSDVIPRDALLVVRYDTRESSDMAALRKMWDNNVLLAASLDTLLSGDPRLLLEGGITEFYYVVLSDDPRPYLVAPKEQFTEQLFTQQSSEQLLSGGYVQVLDKGSWYVVHPISVDPYSRALQNGSFTTLGGIPSAPQPTSMQWIVSPALIALLATDVGGTEQDLNIVDAMSFSSSFDVSNEIVTFTQGPSVEGGQLGPSDIVQSVADYVPSDVSFVRMASNFARDVEAWRQSELPLDKGILSQLEVSEFINQLEGPYAYFNRQGPDGVEDIGLAIALPESLRRSLQIGNPVIEYAIFSMIPFVTDEPFEPGTAYIDTTYNSVPLRYINFLEYTQTVDYAVTDDYIFVSSSKEGMYRIVDTILGSDGSVHNTTPWKNVLRNSDVMFQNGSIVLGSITYPSFLRLLPVAESAKSIPVGLAVEIIPGGDVLMRGQLFVGIGESGVSDLPVN